MLLLPTTSLVIYLLLLVRMSLSVTKKAKNFKGIAYKKAWKLLFPTIFSATVVMYTFLVSNSVSPFNCVSSENDGKVIFVMAMNPIQECYQGAWNSHLPFVILFSIAYGNLFPVAISTLFLQNRRNLDDPQFTAGYGSLISPYRRYFFFWELVAMLKRAAFVTMTQFLSTKEGQYFSKFTASVGTIGFFSGLEILFTPFATRNLNLLSSTYAPTFDLFLIVIQMEHRASCNVVEPRFVV
jgi:NADH:ubiquinone oxidoreductase subunit 6 (subunit J)